MIRYLSLALLKASDPDAEILPGVIVGHTLDYWPVPQLYDARYDCFSRDHSEHNWADVDVQLAHGVSAQTAAAYLRRVAAWLDEHGADLLAHHRVVEAMGAPPQQRDDAPRAHLRAREDLREAVEQRIPIRKP
jgi:hypothetical protein